MVHAKVQEEHWPNDLNRTIAINVTGNLRSDVHGLRRKGGR
jgi:hypothetical protein